MSFFRPTVRRNLISLFSNCIRHTPLVNMVGPDWSTTSNTFQITAMQMEEAQSYCLTLITMSEVVWEAQYIDQVALTVL